MTILRVFKLFRIALFAGILLFMVACGSDTNSVSGENGNNNRNNNNFGNGFNNNTNLTIAQLRTAVQQDQFQNQRRNGERFLFASNDDPCEFDDALIDILTLGITQNCAGSYYVIESANTNYSQIFVDVDDGPDGYTDIQAIKNVLLNNVLKASKNPQIINISGQNFNGGGPYGQAFYNTNNFPGVTVFQPSSWYYGYPSGSYPIGTDYSGHAYAIYVEEDERIYYISLSVPLVANPIRVDRLDNGWWRPVLLLQALERPN